MAHNQATTSSGVARAPGPATAGIGLRPTHMPEIAADPNSLPPGLWLEVHSENFLSAGGPRLAMLDDIRARHAISCHGVGLSLGSHAGLDKAHLDRLKRLFDRVQPALISEHLAWSVIDGAYLNDLLPLPFDEEAFATVAKNVDTAQQVFGRQILVENPSSYVSYASSVIPEWEFLSRLVDKTGCGLLFDVNNAYVSARNTDGNAQDYVRNVPARAIAEIHLAGHTVEDSGDNEVLVDTHSRQVGSPVWELYRETIARLGPKPTLIEWDLDLPPLSMLIEEANKAQAILDTARKPQHAA